MMVIIHQIIVTIQIININNVNNSNAANTTFIVNWIALVLYIVYITSFICIYICMNMYLIISVEYFIKNILYENTK